MPTTVQLCQRKHKISMQYLHMYEILKFLMEQLKGIQSASFSKVGNAKTSFQQNNIFRFEPNPSTL